MNSQHLNNSINEVSRAIGRTWPLYSFVTSNPLSGYEKSAFGEALEKAGKLLKANILPDVSLFRQAWESGDINNEALIDNLAENGFFESPELCLELFENHSKKEIENEYHQVDLIMAKWLAAFMDEGLAEWQMPGRKKGFYKAWRDLARYDNDFNVSRTSDIPETSAQAIEESLHGFSRDEYSRIFMSHLAALPGWTGYIKHRVEANTSWQQNFPISLQDYLGVRFWICKHLNLQILPLDLKTSGNRRIAEMQLIWLKTWEQTWQKTLVQTLKKSNSSKTKQKKKPDAQLVFCIDTRSELIRRHVEAAGNYETYGYAGFFGIAMDYTDLKDGMLRKSCPPIVESAYKVSEIPQKNRETDALQLQKKNQVSGFQDYFLTRMKNMLPSAFGYVEGTGVLYGVSMLARTLTPGFLYRKSSGRRFQQESLCETDMIKNSTNRGLQMISLEEKAGIVRSAFNLMGWKEFAPLVVFAGHGSHTANNAFGSSLDCGACAASPGRNNARMIAKLANLKEVRELLAAEYNILIPGNTVFVGAEHNTTTDEIELFDAQVPESHFEQLENLKKNLRRARETATRDRLRTKDKGVQLSDIKANNWSETRPEWGLAKNAGFIIGPRELTKNSNLDSRCFLHSYNWESDKEGTALEGIMQGPMVVTQWINNHYYFSSVDNEVFGGDSKITHNITGRFGVVKGNGGDLKMGLPLQSLNKTDTEMYHQPLRLSVLIQAPEKRISDILLRNENLKQLLDNEWIYLLVMDPTEENRVKRYSRNMDWQPVIEKAEVNAAKSTISEMELVN
ncbi:DUF2309 domain-containing protein [Christiangramia sabulilitoris]|uniref:Probable inorganic carbon transporter subunit DabA n=1 Tax=Christiangramia sabulilitoris TaxID=2583991 RepID=A0A550I7M5_9FLAO|nr:DUF2309 domain-containing protein [Christiangramia sabulilitoris]TRO66974.1 DUF2309 domain-containing protein [Christiangramia sabulilitoris]